MQKSAFVLTWLLILPAGLVHAEDIAGPVARDSMRAAFKEFERQMITRYFNKHVDYGQEQEDEQDRDYGKKKEEKKDKKDKKAKKDKKKQLPPGISKKLERGGSLPPGIAKRNLPYDLEKDLPSLQEGYERTIVGNDVLLVDVETGEIADIITDAVLGE